MREDIDVRLIDYWLQGEDEKRKLDMQESLADKAADYLFDMRDRPYETK